MKLFITGASSGLGRIWAEAFLRRGDQVAGTARNIDSLKELTEEFGGNFLPVALDVQGRAECIASLNEVKKQFGHIDLIINNAGSGQVGAIEEASEQEAKQLFETNVFGSLWIMQAASPILRAQGKGHFVQVSSVLGIVVTPFMGLYNASKWAVEGLAETLALELKEFGIKITIVEPNVFDTNFAARMVFSEQLTAYDQQRALFFAPPRPETIGRTEATAEAMLTLADSENPPLRLFRGKIGLPLAKQAYAGRLSEWEEWKEISDNAQGR
jgi:NADP-dependent 3-hydroxy acid dehydrogenase YdfG